MSQGTNNNEQKHAQESAVSEYFRLIELVGSDGLYQKLSLALWCVLWLSTGTILLGTPFFMNNPPYTCPDIPGEAECAAYVCSLPPEARQSHRDWSLLTIANNFADLGCEAKWVADLLSSLVYMGCFFGYCSISIAVDNLGRKKSLLIAYALTTLGMGIVYLATNLYMAGAGLFMMGFGSDSAINICFYFITETVESRHRQRYCILVQVFFSLGGITNIAYFYWLRDYRTVTLVFLIIPSLISIGLIVKFIKDTPYYLVKNQQPDQIVAQLSEIHRLNLKQELSNHTEIQIRQLAVLLQNRQGRNTRNDSRIYTPWDLFRYPSIRFISLAVCLLSVFIYILYYGPLMLISKLSFSLYVNALVVTLSELVTYPFSYFLVHCIHRQQVGYVLYGASGMVSLALIFVIGSLCDQPDQCTSARVVELILIFAFRFASSLEFAIFLLYCNEVFPTQVRGMGIGISSALGTVASTASPYVFGSRIDSNSATARTMILFVVISGLGVLLWTRLPETLDMPIRDQIEQVEEGASPQDKHIELVEIGEGD